MWTKLQHLFVSLDFDSDRKPGVFIKSQSWITVLFFVVIFSIGLFLVGYLSYVIIFLPSVFQAEVKIQKDRPFPSQMKAFVGGYRQQLTDLLNDLIPFRQTWIRRTNFWETKLMLGATHSKQVLLGREGWLFFASKPDGDPLSDYIGEARFTAIEQTHAVTNLSNLSEKLKKRDIDFGIFVIPNKSIVYSEYMPQYITRRSEVSAAEDLIQHLNAQSTVSIHYMKNFLLDLKKRNTVPTFFKYDTHWNPMTAFLSLKYMTDCLNLENDTHCMICPIQDSTHHDLATMIHMKTPSDISFSIENYYSNLTFEKINARYPEMDSNPFYFDAFATAHPVNKKRVLFIHDSFGIFIKPFAPKLFTETYFVSWLSFTPEMLERFKPDVIIYQVVERYFDDRLPKLKQLLDYVNAHEADPDFLKR